MFFNVAYLKSEPALSLKIYIVIYNQIDAYCIFKTQLPKLWCATESWCVKECMDRWLWSTDFVKRVLTFVQWSGNHYSLAIQAAVICAHTFAPTSMQAALLIREKQRLRNKRRCKELPSNVATREIAPFPRYPPAPGFLVGISLIITY